MRASRLVSILLLLQTRGRMTASALATELEVSVRTVYRDVESLQQAGVPLYGDAGPAGGYRLIDGYRTRLTGLSAPEAEALFLAGLPGPAAALGLGSVVAAAALKVRAALPEELRDRSGHIQDRFHLDAPGWYSDGDDTPYLVAVADAVWNERQVDIRYRRWTAPTDVTRTLSPLGLVLKAGRWYVVGETEGSIRTFRVDQILDLSPRDEPAIRSPDFDLATYWRGYLVEFRDRLLRDEAVIRLSPQGRERIAEIASGVVADAVEASATEPDAKGWITATIPIESLTHAQTSLLRLGGHVEVVAPLELRERMAVAAAALFELYNAPVAARTSTALRRRTTALPDWPRPAGPGADLADT